MSLSHYECSEERWQGLASAEFNGKASLTAITDRLDTLLRETGTEAVELFLLSPDHERTFLAIHRGEAPRAFRQITQFTYGHGFPGLVAQRGELLLSLDVSHDDRYLRTAVQRLGFHHYLCVPVRGSTGLLGSLHVASRHQVNIPPPLTPVEQAAQHIALILELARFQAAERVATEPLDAALDAGANLRRLARQIVQTLTDVAEMESGALLLLDERHDALHVLGEQDVPSPVLHALTRVCRGTICPALLHQRCLLSKDAERSSAPACRSVERELPTALCLPLLAGGCPVGVALLGSHRTDSSPARHLAFLHPALGRAAVALHNASVAVYEECAARLHTGAAIAPPAAGTVAGNTPHQTSSHREPGVTGVVVAVPFLHLRCLGHFAITRDGQSVPLDQFARRRSVTLLKILLTRYGKPVHRDELTELLWPEGNPTTTPALLNVVVHYLRRGLEPEALAGHPSAFIKATGDSYVFDVSSPHRLDSQELLQAVQEGGRRESLGQTVAAIKSYERAIALYGGDFLADDRYSDWCALERGYLQESFLSAVRRLAALYLHRNDVTAAIECCRHALRIDSTLEDLHRLVMQLLLRDRRRDEALRQYRECRDALQRELGLVPAAETEALHRSIVAGDTAPRQRS
ncbi:MAG: winged helix-turn-helix domain-containing protein [Chloroflexi bacterium]|nr:winged helix-turn-helix domain-containing protein [Chloroflexota bacterium]